MTKRQESDISQEMLKAIESKCKNLLRQDGFRFVGFIDKMGALIEGGLKEGIKPILDSEESRSHYMKQMLDFTMKKDYDDTIGPLEHIITKRTNLQIITIPLNENLLLVTTDPLVDPNQVIKIVKKEFESYS